MSDETKVSVSDFKNWLSGVLDFQPEDWVPNAEQWGKIRDKIEQLEETPAIVNSKVAGPHPNNPAGAGPRHPRPVGPNMGELNQPAVQLPDPPPKKESHVKVKQASNPQIIEGEGQRVFDTGKIHEMGVIDTSETEYESSFK